RSDHGLRNVEIVPGALTLEFLKTEEKVIVVQEVQVTSLENGLLLGAQLAALLGLKRLDAGIPIYRDALLAYLFWDQRQGRHCAVPLEIVLATVTTLLSGTQHLEPLPEVVCDRQRNCKYLLLIVARQLFLFEELAESLHEV